MGSAALYGAADFIGGVTSRRAETVAIVLVSQAAGLILVAGLVWVDAAPGPDWADARWGGLAGLAGGIGVAFLYRALAVDVMAVVAPITAVCAVFVPVAIAVLLGERREWSQSGGMAVAMAAIVLVSQQADGSSALRRRAGVGLALVAGVAIGFFFLALANTNFQAGLWPLAAARVASVLFFGAVAILAAAPCAWNDA